MLSVDRRKYELCLARKHLTTTEMASRMNISRQRLAAILNQRNVSPEVVGRLARALGVDVTEIIEQ